MRNEEGDEWGGRAVKNEGGTRGGRADSVGDKRGYRLEIKCKG